MSDDFFSPTPVDLPAGLLIDGKVYRTVSLVPMVGATRKDIARPEIRRDSIRVANAIMLACIKEMEPFGRVTGAHLNRLLVGDREFLLLAIRRISSGNIVHFSMSCDACEQPFDSHVDLSTDIKVDTLPVDVEVTALGEGEGKQEFWTFTASDVEAGVKEITFRFPTGHDQAIVAPAIRANPVDGTYRLMWLCLHSFNGTIKNELPTDLFDGLPLPMLDFIQREFRNHQPGPDYSEPVVCPNCGAPNAMSLKASDFFFDLVSRKKRPQTSTNAQ